jgi:hypothetical protein
MSAELDQIREHLVRIEQLLITPKIEPRTVTAQQACVLTGHQSPSAFYRWAKQSGLKPCGFGLYLIKQVDLALHRNVIRRSAPAEVIPQ